MTEKELILLLSYLINNEVRFQKEKRELQFSIRFREVSDIDVTELLIASARLQTFEDVSRDIRALLRVPEEKYLAVLRQICS